MIYVALLRGINVGGNSKISMLELKNVFEKAGMSAVSTYINSGNVIFQTDAEDSDKITDILEKAIEARFGFKIRLVVRTKDNILALLKVLPETWANNAEMKCDVMFLWKAIDSPDILNQLTIKPGIDNVIYAEGALLWSADRKDMTRSGMLRLVGTDIYKQMTIRNCNTLRRLAALVSA